ncbi:FixH family protein [Gilvimarinus sp. DA14]|uniref:FixH family protein n=1 Tax=Gilvimarinus sp. DA14 TaxID=2956798 RepID=UPI0020B79B0E|nr:FixH family protein [Gilvimarinus sp. DA14]UTF60048.1 FixH family protein [Gilvimarinus sp. DA14]
MQDRSANPWYREPWAWFVLTPLIVVVIVSLSFVTVAVRHADDTVIDNYYKQGRMINQSLEQDKRAANWQLQAELQWRGAKSEVNVELSSPVIPAPEELTLWLDHPFEESLDTRLTLQKVSDTSYRAQSPNLTHQWYVTLVPGRSDSGRTDSPWRLRGEINFDHREQWTLSPTVP